MIFVTTALCSRLRELHVRHRSGILKKIAKLFKIEISNPFQSSPSSAILVPFCFRINPLVFFFLIKPLFFQHFNRNLGRWRNDSKYRDVAPLSKRLDPHSSSPQVYKWLPVNLMLGGFPCDRIRGMGEQKTTPSGLNTDFNFTLPCYWKQESMFDQS